MAVDGGECFLAGVGLWWIYFGKSWVVVGVGGYILAGGGWWMVIVDGGEWWWVVVDGGGWWRSLV